MTRTYTYTMAMVLVFAGAAIAASEWTFGTDSTWPTKAAAMRAARQHAMEVAAAEFDNPEQSKLTVRTRGTTRYAVRRDIDAAGADGWRCTNRAGEPLSDNKGSFCTLTERQYARRVLLPGLQVQRVAAEKSVEEN